MRVTFTPYTERKCSLLSTLPFIPLLVTTIRRLTICCGCSSSCQSTSICGPINAATASASASAHTIRISSLTWNTVSVDGIDNSPLCIKRVQTTSRFKKSVISCRVRPPIYEFSTRKYIVWGLALGLSPSASVKSAFSLSMSTLHIKRIANVAPIIPITPNG